MSVVVDFILVFFGIVCLMAYLSAIIGKGIRIIAFGEKETYGELVFKLVSLVVGSVCLTAHIILS